MDASIYVAMTGAQQTMLAQATNAHNLANASTTGFRADLSQFRSMPVFGEGFDSRTYSMAERPGVDFSPGPIDATGRALDIAVKNEGWIAVVADDGTQAYTRAGDLQVDSAGGFLRTGAGQMVMGNGGPVAVPPFQTIAIGNDGTVSVVPAGQLPDQVVQVDRIKLVNPPLDTLVKGPDGLFRTVSGEEAAADGSVSITSGALESSNVNIVDGLVEMISLARRFEMQIKMMQTADQNESALAQLMNLS